MQQNFKDVHCASQYRGKIYIAFPPTKQLDENIATKIKGETRIYTPHDFDADMLLDQTLAASATTFISDSHSTYSVIMDARRPLNSSIVISIRGLRRCTPMQLG
jgi:7-keto-8-aminopelargonate synthetase-like enzyme